MDPRLSRYWVRRAGRPPPSVLLVVGIKRKSTAEPLDLPVDLASRIGMPAAFERSAAAAPETIRRVDGPIEAPRSGRPLLIGANEPLPVVLPVAAPVPVLAPAVVLEPAPEGPAMEYAPLAATTREAPGAGEMDLVVTPLPTPDDFDEDLESPVADIVQCLMDGKGDHIYATRFLARFVAPGSRGCTSTCRPPSALAGSRTCPARPPASGCASAQRC